MQRVAAGLSNAERLHAAGAVEASPAPMQAALLGARALAEVFHAHLSACGGARHAHSTP